MLSNLKVITDLDYLVQGFDVRLGALDKFATYFADDSPMDATHLVCILLWKLLSTNEDVSDFPLCNFPFLAFIFNLLNDVVNPSQFFALFVQHAQAPSIIRCLLRFSVRTAMACFEASHEKVSSRFVRLLHASQLPDLQNQLLLDRMCLVEFILLLLSSSRDFSVRLNDQVEISSDLGFPGSPCCLADHVLFAVWK